MSVVTGVGYGFVSKSTEYRVRTYYLGSTLQRSELTSDAARQGFRTMALIPSKPSRTLTGQRGLPAAARANQSTAKGSTAIPRMEEKKHPGKPHT